MPPHRTISHCDCTPELVLLVGHSYGSSVITAAGTADNVVGLVYMSGFGRDEGENLTDLQSKFFAPYIVQDQFTSDGREFTLAPEGFHESFCAEDNGRHQLEPDVTGPLLLTQAIAKQMVRRETGRIVWVSSREGLNLNRFTGIYSASKHAPEAIAETMAYELQEFGVEVATVNPGPFLADFNDRMFQTWESWEDDPSQRLFDHFKHSFPRAQFDPEAVYATLTAVAAGEVDRFRNLEPKVDDRGDQAAPAGPVAAEGHRAPANPLSVRSEVLRDAAGDTGRRARLCLI
jgi:NAD(P)-dependent dehydrogenase (short-subunit alcohol dehydrogenase family)